MTTSSIDAVDHASRRKWYLLLGVILLTLGIAGIAVPNFLEVSSLILGVMLLVSSLLQFLTAAFMEKGKERFLHFLAAGLEGVFGLVVMANPFETVAGLILVAAMVWLVLGLARLIRAQAASARARGWIVMTGIVAILLGVFLVSGFFPAKLAVIALCIGTDFICHGVTWSALALKEGQDSKTL